MKCSVRAMNEFLQELHFWGCKILTRVMNTSMYMIGTFFSVSVTWFSLEISVG